ncbi:MAG: hypothetical protein JWP58_3804 [Hymenobacter sp.]|nr:hypothetical protein [Hymenobacter sp.]
MSLPYPWQEPWVALPESVQATFQLQMARELVQGHPLYGRKCTLLGKHAGTDDVLVALEDGRLAVVHLTWGGPGDALYPHTTFFADWDDFATHRMAPDTLDYL